MWHLSIILLTLLSSATALGIFCLLLSELDRSPPGVRMAVPFLIFILFAMPFLILLSYEYIYGFAYLTSFVLYSLGVLIVSLPKVYPEVMKMVQGLGQVSQGSWYLVVLGGGVMFQSLLGMSLLKTPEPRLLTLSISGFLFFFTGFILSQSGKSR